MNLNENIYRIHQMMGIITENKKVEVLRNMIDKIGLYQAGKMVGGYDELKNLVNREDKINFINDFVKKVNGLYAVEGQLSVHDFDLNSIPFESDDESYTGYIEYFGDGWAVVLWYDDSEDVVGDTTVDYNELPDDIIDNIVSQFMNITT
jgi:hypothetical protein